MLACLLHDEHRLGMLGFSAGEAQARDLSYLDYSATRDLSADGKLLLFDESGAGGGPVGSVYMRGTDGSPPVRLGDGAAAALAQTKGSVRLIMERRIERRHTGCPLIFHASGRSFKAPQGGLPNRFYVMWKKACSTIGLPDLRPYDLRRSAIRNLIHAGVPELTAMKISGHRSRETFRRYAIEDPSEIAAAIERVGAYVTPRMKGRGKVIRFSKRGRNTDTTRTRRAR